MEVRPGDGVVPVRSVKVDMKQPETPPAEQRLAQARSRLLAARKELRAAAAAVSEWESSRPKPRRFAVFSRRGGDGEMTAPVEAMQRLAEAQEACRIAQAEVDELEVAPVIPGAEAAELLVAA